MICPDAECHDKVIQLNFFMKIVGLSIAILVSILLTVGLVCFAGSKEKTARVTDNEKKIAIIQTDLKHIVKTQDEIKKAVDQIQQQQITKEQTKEIIREIHND